MRRRHSSVYRLAVIVLLAMAAGCMTMEKRLAKAGDIRSLAQAAADFYVKDGNDDTCVVGIVCGNDGTPVFAGAGGADEHSLYRIASLSKLFFAPVVKKLHEEGCIDLDRPVSAYSKLDLPPECARVTLRNLLENKSGLPREFLTPWNPVDMFTAFRCGFVGSHIYSGFDSRESFSRELNRPKWRSAMKKGGNVYSNVGFALLGMTVEDAMGSDLETILADWLTRPLGLADTAYVPRGDQTNRVTHACAGHLPWLVRRRHKVPDHRLGDALRATGGLFSSAADCIALCRHCWPMVDAYIEDRPLDSYPDEAVYGLLRVHVLRNGRRIVYRAGMIYGGASFVGYDPATRSLVVILRNVTSWPDRRGFEVMERLNALASPAPSDN